CSRARPAGSVTSSSSELQHPPTEPGCVADGLEEAVREQVVVAAAHRQEDVDGPVTEADAGVEVSEALQRQHRIDRLAVAPQSPGERAERQPGGERQMPVEGV